MATTKMTHDEVVAKVEAVLGTSQSIEIATDDPALGGAGTYLHIVKVMHKLSLKCICIERKGDKVRIFRIGSDGASASPKASITDTDAKRAAKGDKPKATKAPKVDRSKHSSRAYAKEADCLDIMADDASHVMFFAGPTGCGKTYGAKRLAELTGRVFYRMQGYGEATAGEVIGEKTIVVDEATGQSVVKFVPGTLVQAMTEGLDEDGNEVGPAGFLDIDEFTSYPAHIIIMLNAVLESDDPRRTLVIECDGGRVIKSHSQFRIVVTGNTVGRGAQTMQEAMYAAQGDAQDLSVLNRVAVIFRFGYDKKLEKSILMEKVGDDKVVKTILKFRDKIRGHIRTGKLTSPMGTRHLIYIADMHRIWGDLGKAVYTTLLGRLGPEERAVYNETFHAITGTDLLKKFEAATSDIDYM